MARECQEVVVRIACLMFVALLVTADGRAQALLHDVPDTSTTSPSAVPPRPSVDTPTVFRAGTDLVALSVVVTDSSAQFVTGLQPRDFAVYEDGVQQDVSFF